MAAFKIESGKAKGLLKKLGYSVSSASPKKLLKHLNGLPEKEDLDDDDLDKKDQRLFDEVCEAVAKDRKIVVTDGDDDDDDEKTAKKGGKKKAGKKEEKVSKKGKKGAKAEKEDKKSKKKGKKSGGGGPSNKDKVFEKWLQSSNPGKDAKKWAKQFPDVAETTIRGWISNWKKGPDEGSFPRAAQGRDKEIKKAMKNHD